MRWGGSRRGRLPSWFRRAQKRFGVPFSFFLGRPRPPVVFSVARSAPAPFSCRALPPSGGCARAVRPAWSLRRAARFLWVGVAAAPFPRRPPLGAGWRFFGGSRARGGLRSPWARARRAGAGAVNCRGGAGAVVLSRWVVPSIGLCPGGCRGFSLLLGLRGGSPRSAPRLGAGACAARAFAVRSAPARGPRRPPAWRPLRFGAFLWAGFAPPFGLSLGGRLLRRAARRGAPPPRGALRRACPLVPPPRGPRVGPTRPAAPQPPRPPAPPHTIPTASGRGRGVRRGGSRVPPRGGRGPVSPSPFRLRPLPFGRGRAGWWGVPVIELRE